MKNMKIDLVSAVFSPEPITSARANADLAEQLTHDGHRVRVITPFPNRPAGKLYEGYRRQLWQQTSSTIRSSTSWGHAFKQHSR